jgi:hypothetical protein
MAQQIAPAQSYTSPLRLKYGVWVGMCDLVLLTHGDVKYRDCKYSTTASTHSDQHLAYLGVPANSRLFFVDSRKTPFLNMHGQEVPVHKLLPGMHLRCTIEIMLSSKALVHGHFYCICWDLMVMRKHEKIISSYVPRLPPRARPDLTWDAFYARFMRIHICIAKHHTALEQFCIPGNYALLQQELESRLEIALMGLFYHFKPVVDKDNNVQAPDITHIIHRVQSKLGKLSTSEQHTPCHFSRTGVTFHPHFIA